MPIEKYNHTQEVIELFEDVSLGYLARERDLKSKRSDYIDIKKAFRKLKKQREEVYKKLSYRLKKLQTGYFS